MILDNYLLHPIALLLLMVLTYVTNVIKLMAEMKINDTVKGEIQLF